MTVPAMFRLLLLSCLVGAPMAAQPGPRRAAVLDRLGSRILIAPSQAAFKSDDQAGFNQASDFYYLTGLDDVVGAVLVLNGQVGAATLFLPPPNPLITRPLPSPGITTARSLGLFSVEPIDSLEPWLRRAVTGVPEVVVSPTDVRGAVTLPPPMANGVVRWRHYLRSLGYQGEVAPATSVIRPVREIKDATEIGIIAKVGVASGQAMMAGLRALKPGRTQRQAEHLIIKGCADAGTRPSFWPWAMTGPRAVYTDLYNSFVDYEGHDRVMQAGELARVDVGCQRDHYMGDVGRTAPVSGRFSAGQREAWDLFIAGYRAGLVALKDGAEVSTIFRLALDKIAGLAPTLRTPMGRQAAETILGPNGIEAWQIHGVGLDDAEGRPERLKAGMTVAYELMFAIGDQGFYLEDMILIEPNGYRMLTPDLPYTAAEIEAAMARR